jgi:hypothetical protein
MELSETDKLWHGVNLKLEHAAFFQNKMSRSLQPDRTPTSAVQESAGAIVGNDWQRSFYAYLDAFLAMARSVPEIINCCFGKDKQNKEMAQWFQALDADEQRRREEFTREFEAVGYSAFRKHHLSTARNSSFHRAGVTPLVQVTHTGLFGVTYVGSPTAGIPVIETRRFAEGDVLGAQAAAFQQPLPVRPLWSDFNIDGKPLFAECQSYLELATGLAGQARGISQSVHGDATLTPPPGLT